MTCLNCTNETVYAKGLCRADYEYLRRTGHLRDENLAVARARRRFERDLYRQLIRDVMLAAEGEIA